MAKSPRHGCCVDKACDDATCMQLPAGESCSTCVHHGRCTSMFGAKSPNTWCGFFPRRFRKLHLPEPAQPQTTLFVVYVRPSDYPDKVVVRKWTMSDRIVTYEATPHTIVGDIHEARRSIPPRFVRCERHAADDLAIAEMWTDDPAFVEAYNASGIFPACRVCGCTDANCLGCIERTGHPCHWVEPDLCSACVPEGD